MDHKQLAVQLFHDTWDILDQTDRTPQEDAKMIHLAHASLYHWLQVGTPLEWQRGEWMISHVYAALGMGESALYHAQLCLEYTREHAMDDFDLTFAYEAMARALSVLKDPEAKTYLDLAYASLKQIQDLDDRTYASSQLDAVQLLMN